METTLFIICGVLLIAAIVLAVVSILFSFVTYTAHYEGKTFTLKQKGGAYSLFLDGKEFHKGFANVLLGEANFSVDGVNFSLKFTFGFLRAHPHLFVNNQELPLVIDKKRK